MNNYIEEAKKAIIASSDSTSIYIGCDSIRYPKRVPVIKNGEHARTKSGHRMYSTRWFAKFTTVIILHIDSKHGGKIFHNSIHMEDYGNLKQRLMSEVNMAVEAATGIIDVVGKRHMEIHLDINPDEEYKSSIAVKEALGYVRSMNFEPKIKPESFAATHAADHAVRHWQN